MKTLRLVVLAALLLALRPGVAHADSIIMEFIEGWSGPGPFKVIFSGLDLRVACLPNALGKLDRVSQQFLNCYRDDAERLKGRFMFNINTGSNGGTQLFADDAADVRTVHQLTYELLYMHQLNSVVELGGGVQWVRLSSDEGTAFSFTRTGFPIRLMFTPLGFLHFSGKKQALARLVHLSYESAYFGGTIQASDFGNTTSRFKASKEFQSRLVSHIDVSPLIFAKWPHP
jgi:hypothetical protein